MVSPNETEMGKKGERTCVGCGRADAPAVFLRVVLGEGRSRTPTDGGGGDVGGEHEVVVDAAGGAFGRGAHVHPSFDCLVKACKGGFARSFKTKVRMDAGDLATAIEEAHDRRVTGLVMGARRAGHVAIGTDAAMEALAKGPALAIVACDAGSVAGKDAVMRAAAEGRAVVWKDKAVLGKLFGRDEVGIFCVTHAEIAREIQEARSRSEACRRREVR
jgi:predicted RNA-binding protein YlxR (DUF448 family)